LLAKHTSKASQYIAYADSFCTDSFLCFPISLFQPLCRSTQYTICYPFGCGAILLDLMNTICEEVDVRF
jgi:hypothetical protein